MRRIVRAKEGILDIQGPKRAFSTIVKYKATESVLNHQVFFFETEDWATDTKSKKSNLQELWSKKCMHRHDDQDM